MTPAQIAYRQYLESNHWRLLRAEAFRVHGRKCFKCPKTFGLDVHHLRYRHPWTLCTVEDVRPCCRDCHEKEHGIVRVVSVQEKHCRQRRKGNGWKRQTRWVNKLLAKQARKKLKAESRKHQPAKIKDKHPRWWTGMYEGKSRPER